MSLWRASSVGSAATWYIQYLGARLDLRVEAQLTARLFDKISDRAAICTASLESASYGRRIDLQVEIHLTA